MDLIDKKNNVRTRADLVEFIRSMLADLEADPSCWENDTLGSFLEAMAAWVASMDNYYKNVGTEFSEDQPWKLFAQMLLAATAYE